MITKKNFYIPACKIFFLVAVLIIGISLFSSPVSAMLASSSAKASPQATSSASLTQKINELKEKAASKAADFLAQVTKKLQNKAYYGVITSISGDTLKISYQNHDHSMSTNEYTAFSSTLKTTKKVTTLKDFAEGDFVSGLGDADDKGVLKAKKLIKSAPIASDSSKLIWGQVEKVTGGTIIVKLADSTDQTITSSGKNPIFLGQEEGTMADIKIGRTIISRGKQTSNAGLSSTYIYIVPPSADAKPEKAPESTKSSIIVSASPSATPKKK